ncbi:MAG: 1-deoxy-D-xylulose-5-phosphate synthase [Clostridia bacterium]|nr:1-deoxy-D-xylulose-5-phosphate synthase [Clostridia bacterium]
MSEIHSLLDSIQGPEDLKRLSLDQVRELADELRSFLVQTVTEKGGHLASNLGVVELTLAMHRVFDSPKDHFIFDVGHQAYVHKILTGRKEAFRDSLRKNGGISGFTRRVESEHDPFGAGHASTSVSAGLGMATADKRKGNDSWTVCVVGDGAFTGGMIHEALNNIDPDLHLIVILNENEMSISRNTGIFAKRLSSIRSREGYYAFKDTTGKVIQRIPLIGKPLFRALHRLKTAIKDAVYGSNFFEDLGLFYLGPVDGNDPEKTETILRIAKELRKSVLVHVKTVKGKGWKPSEEEPDRFHAVAPGRYSPEDGALLSGSRLAGFTETFGETVCSAMESEEDLVAVTAAMTEGTGLSEAASRFPDRVFDVGIAEEHALTFAAGLSAGGLSPVVAIYSSFLQRAYDNLIHDLSLQDLSVLLCIDRAGLNEGDGVTHHGIFDVSMLLQLPNATVFAPISESSLRNLFLRSVHAQGITAIRYPKGCDDPRLLSRFPGSESGEWHPIRTDYPSGTRLDLLFVTYGRIAAETIEAETLLQSEGIASGTVLLEQLTPVITRSDEIAGQIRDTGVGAVLLVEEGILSGGLAAAVLEALLNRTAPNVKCGVCAVENPFEPSVPGKRMAEVMGLDSFSLAKRARILLKEDSLSETN